MDVEKMRKENLSIPAVGPIYKKKKTRKRSYTSD